ncbi:hypothetical protein [Urechidicola vernalis]|uniref:Tetratricopeptide repeat protein n=1 Tax=Urechidicola vernalis TaxID=3075600 RepID=A0ABU2Y8V0_9FLAO|nr:hypothetical protein [Urechidicola sp. P050]MDT0553690.1 hypothetical protein [Urechidicola sp. P050]
MDLKKFFSELKRRNVYKVAITYAITSWLLAQLASLAASSFGAPDWVIKMIIVLLFIGFPIALILAWAFEMSPQGMIRTASVAAQQNPYSERKKKPLTSNLFIGILIVIIIGQFVYSNYSSNAVKNIDAIEKSIAVLPFINDSENKENLYFCNGIMEGILDHLSKIEALSVTSRTSVEQYRENKPSLRKIAEELDVKYLVEGSVQRVGDQVVIFAQLIYAEDDTHLWSKRYKKQLTDVFAVQADVTESIAETLQTIILPEVQERIEAIPTLNEKAYDYYLKGEEYFNRTRVFTQSSKDWLSNLEKARLNYQMAIESDSLMAEPFAGLAAVEFDLNRNSSILEENYLENVLELSNKAIRLNPNIFQAYLIRGRYYFNKNKKELAKKDYLKAEKLNPNDLFPLWGLLNIACQHDFDFLKGIKILKEIESKTKTVQDKDRLNIFYTQFYSRIGDLKKEKYYSNQIGDIEEPMNSWYYSKQGMFREALKSIQYYYEDNQIAEAGLGGVYLYLKEYEKSIEHYEKWREKVKADNYDSYNTANDLHRIGQAYYLIGQKEKGVDFMKDQIKIYERTLDLQHGTTFQYHGALYDLAGIYAFLGEKEKSYSYLERFEKENGWMAFGDLEHFIKVDPQFNNLRGENRFEVILSKGVEQKEKVRQEVRDYLNSIESVEAQSL